MKFALLLLAVTASAEIAVPTCKPNSKFMNYCNKCFCSKDGLSYVCTKIWCDRNIWNVDGSRKSLDEYRRNKRSDEKQICEPRSQFKNYCNICACSNDGLSFGCTKMTCDETIWNANGTLKVTPIVERRSPGKRVCKPNSQFKSYCNTCGCSDDGSSFLCTKMMCDETIWNQDGSLKTIPKNHRDKRSASKQVCKSRSQFKNYCNTCACSDDGLNYECTKMMCDKRIWNEDGTLKDISQAHQVTEPGEKVCQPRSYFKSYCNTCGCSDDGMSFTCTKMMCDETVWNQDGSLKIIPTLNKIAKPNNFISNSL